MIDHAGPARGRRTQGSDADRADAVLGLSMTPTSVGLVLVDGQDADGTLMDRDTFATDGILDGSEQATAAVIAATRGVRLQSIGVTWSEDADAQATMLMQSLSDSGFDNVMAIRLPEATEALARGIADVLGHETTAVCVIEPDSVIALIVNTSDGAVQTAFNHAIDCDEALVSWLSTIFTQADWAPEALVVVGSAGGVDSIMPLLEDALAVPVFAPEEAKLALARGAALASAQNTDLPLHLFDGVAEQGDGRGRHAPGRRRWSSMGPAAMLAAGVVTFVVSVSVAISLQLSPSRETPPNPVHAARTEPAAEPSPPAIPPPTATIEPTEEAAPSPAPEEPAPVYQESPVAVTEAPSDPATDAASDGSSDGAPAADPGLIAPSPDASAGSVAPPYAAPPVPAVPTKKPGILSRIKERLTRGDDN